MYVAPQLDLSWLLNRQRILYTRSHENPECAFRKLWGLVTDPCNLRSALARVARNKGRRTAGVDGITVGQILTKGVDVFVSELRAELRAGNFRPSPVRRVLIPKKGQPGKHRPLGIPTVKDRVVQAAMKNILEPIFEADFFHTSHGFRPGKSVHGAIEHLRMVLRPHAGKTKGSTDRRLSYQWAIEGDIKGCFDNISHHGLMVRVRRRVLDPKVNRLLVAFLQAGILSERTFVRSEAGTPQGGILSPLLANIALSAIDERYARHAGYSVGQPVRGTRNRRAVWNRGNDRTAGKPILFPIRYADDFLILVGLSRGLLHMDRAKEIAEQEKQSLAAFLKETLNLELSETKTLVTPVTKPMRFLGHHVRVRTHPTNGKLVVANVIPKECSHRFRERIKAHFGPETVGISLEQRVRTLNLMVRGWCYFYRHAWGAKHVFDYLDHYIWWTIYRWLKKKHRGVAVRTLFTKYGRRTRGRRTIRWGEGSVVTFVASRVRVQQYKLGWQKTPDFANTSLESPVHNERCTPGLERGARKPAGES
jgi:RNA-directed DNA polymerase